MSRWDRYVLRPRIWMETSRSGTVPHIGPYKLPYTFDHIWTNLLTQCTSVLVPVFCCFSISGFPTIKSAQRILNFFYKKSAQRNLPESPKEGRRGHETPNIEVIFPISSLYHRRHRFKIGA